MNISDEYLANKYKQSLYITDRSLVYPYFIANLNILAQGYDETWINHVVLKHLHKLHIMLTSNRTIMVYDYYYILKIFEESYRKMVAINCDKVDILNKYKLSKHLTDNCLEYCPEFIEYARKLLHGYDESWKDHELLKYLYMINDKEIYIEHVGEMLKTFEKECMLYFSE